MNAINNIAELKLLQPRTKFYEISKGNAKGYYFSSLHPLYDNLVIGISDANTMTAKVFSYSSFGMGVCFLYGDYNSVEVGEIMKFQLQEEIKSIEEIYLATQTNLP